MNYFNHFYKLACCGPNGLSLRVDNAPPSFAGGALHCAQNAQFDRVLNVACKFFQNAFCKPQATKHRADITDELRLASRRTNLHNPANPAQEFHHGNKRFD